MNRLPATPEIRPDHAPLQRAHAALLLMVVALDTYRSTGELPVDREAHP
jgi:hypothetical protein